MVDVPPLTPSFSSRPPLASLSLSGRFPRRMFPVSCPSARLILNSMQSTFWTKPFRDISYLNFPPGEIEFQDKLQKLQDTIEERTISLSIRNMIFPKD